MTGFLRCDSGGIAIIGGAVLPVVIGFAALAIEAGHWYLDGRVMQGAADAAAISAASSYLAGESGYVSVGQSFATANGYQDGTNSASVTVAPINAQNQIIVDIARVETAVFLSIPVRTTPTPCGGLSTRLICIKAHAVVTVASTAANGNGCLIGLSRSTTGSALIVGGNGNIQAPSCVAASDTCGGATAAQCTAPGLALNGGGQVNLAELDVATQNAFACPSGGSCTIASEKTDYPLWTRDPFATYTMPAAGSCTNPQPTTVNGITTYQPGVYCNGISVSGKAVVVFNPGIYFLISSNFSVTGGAINQQYVASASVVSQGSGYKNNDTVTVSGGTAASAATLKLTVTGGKISAVTVANAGAYMSPLPANPVSVTGGKGTGATVTLTYANPGTNGVSFLLTGSAPGTVNIKNAAITLSAPTSGPTNGLVFWQDKAATAGGGVFNGNAQPTTLMTITGALYFPSQEVTIAGNSVFQPTQCTAIVANVIDFQGLGSISKGCLPVSGGGSGSSGNYRLSQ